MSWRECVANDGRALTENEKPRPSTREGREAGLTGAERTPLPRWS